MALDMVEASINAQMEKLMKVNLEEVTGMEMVSVRLPMEVTVESGKATNVTAKAYTTKEE